MEDTFADDTAPPMTPVESAIICMDRNLNVAMMFIKEMKNLTAQLETSCKLMSYELGEIKKNLTEKE